MYFSKCLNSDVCQKIQMNFRSQSAKEHYPCAVYLILFSSAQPIEPENKSKSSYVCWSENIQEQHETTIFC